MTTVRPVSARSALLSMLLGAHPPTMTARALVAAVGLVGVAESAARAALSRMVAAGDLDRADGRYTLSPRLLARQRRQDAAVDPETCPWSGAWEAAVITTTGRDAADRAALRADLSALRLAELREGVWLRPANLARRWPDLPVTRLTARPADHPATLAATLWDLDAWSTHARTLLKAAATTDEPARFAAVAMSVRHLMTDPVLPAELLPPHWPGPALRANYAEYRAWLKSLAGADLAEHIG
ncbi:PaaX family transcriptional regulator C-terminal domain-containing protein [Actinokineospora guangxiensis]|uniref:PaaX family transcriptional regulator C-terminal domain-containing protein n=1 Tax=Actinokineospora guangxiensis TaxID=1490288 RepID=A0ABW0EU96_9PSEU